MNLPLQELIKSIRENVTQRLKELLEVPASYCEVSNTVFDRLAQGYTVIAIDHDKRGTFLNKLAEQETFLVTAISDAFDFMYLESYTLQLDGSTMEEYVARIEMMYVRGEDNAYEAYLNFGEWYMHNSLYQRRLPESDLDYVRRCARMDFRDGIQGKALYQEVYDAVMVAASAEAAASGHPKV